MRDCGKCKHSCVDYILDQDTYDEYPIYYCSKGNETELDFQCDDYEEE